ncbi:Hypothetical predicted protein [Cloeon dipterum]|uniref:RanBP2-type domain-containing protein n=1 Tax=Cloeon dipterum TaxID=197152 RepID=A0A8S1DXZ0_9INSE|nr:Hypothetical predicted protein [Cloeon dipterum]
MSVEMTNNNPMVGNKRLRLSTDGRCIGGCGNPSCSEKRKTEEDSDHNVRWWFIKLDSESEPFDSDEPDSLKNESVWSVQERDTDSVHDSSDSENRWRQTHVNEYEVASLHSGNELKPFSCSSDDESCSSVEGLVVATVAPDGITIDYFADSSSDSDSSDESSDPELQPQDKWSCLKCKQKNQPIPRYCQHCFAVRKQWFPPRPKAHKKRQEANHEPVPIPPQIPITPNLTIPDLSDPKGNPGEDSIQRSYSDSVSRYASMTQEQKLDQLKEQIQRNKLVQAHSDKHLTDFLNEKTPDEIINPRVSSKGPETIKAELPEGESGGKKSCHSNSGAVAKARSSSSNSSAKTIRVESKIVQAHDGVR